MNLLPIVGKVLVGHGLKNDLIALGIEHPLSSMRDTSNYAKFQRRDGSTHSLKKLAKQWLNKDIQPKSKSHSAKCEFHHLQLSYGLE